MSLNPWCLTMSKLNKANWKLFWFGVLKIPAIRFSRAWLTALSDHELILRIPNKKRNRNHLNSIYIANYAIGADLACGFLAFQILENRKLKASLLFKSLSAEFIKRAESDLFFKCNAAIEINNMIDLSVKTGERQNKMIRINAYVVENQQEEPVAEITIELSIKIKP